MIKAIDNRRSIRKYTSEEIPQEIIEEMIYAATLAPSAKNRQPWKFIVFKGAAKDELVQVMCQGIEMRRRLTPLCLSGHLPYRTQRIP